MRLFEAVGPTKDEGQLRALNVQMTQRLIPFVNR